MTGNRGNTRISKIRHPIRWFKGWLGDPARTNADALLAGVVGTALFSALGALAGVLLSAFNVINFGGKLPTSLAAAAGGFCLATGIVLGVFLVRRFYYRPRLDAVESALEQAHEDVRHLSPLRDVTRRHEAYAEHIHQLLRQLCGNGFATEVANSLLVKPARIIEEVTGVKVRLSIWTQQKSRRRFGSPRWKLEFAPEHTESQRNDFGVPLKNSWIAYMEAQKRSPEKPKGKSDFVFGINDLDNAEPEGHDLTAFKEHGFKSLRGTSVVSSDDSPEAVDDIRCLVALAEQPEAFSETEDWYIIFLGQIFSLHQDDIRLSPHVV